MNYQAGKRLNGRNHPGIQRVAPFKRISEISVGRGGASVGGGGGALVLAASCLLLAVAFRKIQPDIQDTEYCKLYRPGKLTFSQHLFPATNTSSCVGNNEEI